MVTRFLLFFILIVILELELLESLLFLPILAVFLAFPLLSAPIAAFNLIGPSGTWLAFMILLVLVDCTWLLLSRSSLLLTTR